MHRAGIHLAPKLFETGQFYLQRDISPLRPFVKGSLLKLFLSERRHRVDARSTRCRNETREETHNQHHEDR